VAQGKESLIFLKKIKMIECTCINDSNRPTEISALDWPIKGKTYHIIWIYFHAGQNVSGVDLKEIKLTADNMPFRSFKLERFAFKKEDLEALLELMKVCSSKIDINKAIEEQIELVEN